MDQVLGVSLTFKETVKLFSNVLVPLSTHCSGVWASSHPVSSSMLVMLSVPNFNHSNCCVVASCCGFNCITFLLIVSCTFACAYLTLMYLL